MADAESACQAAEESGSFLIHPKVELEAENKRENNEKKSQDFTLRLGILWS